MTEAQLYQLAAAGDVDAQAALVARGLSLGRAGLCTPAEAAFGVEMTARMAAAHGRPHDRQVLVGVLLIIADSSTDWERRKAYIEEAQELLAAGVAEGNDDAGIVLAALLSGLADEGDEDAARRLLQLSDLLDASTMTSAAEFSRAVHQIAEELR